jgi:hypothetical protein
VYAERGVTLLLAVENGPLPRTVTAATLKTYAMPVVNPVTVALVAEEADRETVAQVLPLFDEYCTV